MRRTYAAAIGAVSAAAVLSGAGLAVASASTASTASTARHDGHRGIETIRASTTNVNASSLIIHASGVFTATGTFTSPSGSGAAVVHFVFPKGTLTADGSAVTNGPLHLNQATCAVSQAGYVTYTISPAQSTGRYAGATGHGHATLTFSGTAPRLADGKCNTSSNAQPVPGTARETLLIKGPLTLKSRRH
jgi:hypothetical protein